MPSTTIATMKISEWLNNRGSHNIYYSARLGRDFKEATGFDPNWPEHSIAATKQAIKARGLGGELVVDAEEKCAYGWEIAEGLAAKYAGYAGSQAMGRGFRFRDALEALRKAGM